MKTLVPLLQSSSHRGVVEMQRSIRDNTYKSFGTTICIAAVAAALMTLLVMRTPPVVVDSLIPRQIVKIDVMGDPHINTPIKTAPMSPMHGTMFVQKIDTVQTEPEETKRNLAVGENNAQQSQSGAGVGGQVVSTSQGTGSSTTGHDGSEHGAAQSPADENYDLRFAEVDPVVDLHALQSNIEYPAFMRRIGASGEVRIAVLVSETGHIDACNILQSTDERFSTAAIDAVRRTSFSPGTTNGIAVKSWVIIPIVFAMR